MNALKTGLTGRTVLMPGEDAEAYRLHCERFEDQFQPATPEEKELVQSLADLKWRLLRCSQLEHNLFALGRVEFAQTFDHEPEPVRSALIQAHTLRTYAKDLNNLSIQETRLDKRFQRELKELNRIQTERRNKNASPSARPHSSICKPKKRTSPSTPPNLGSNFQSRKSISSSKRAARPELHKCGPSPSVIVPRASRLTASSQYCLEGDIIRPERCRRSVTARR